jgi:hypothetical protein
MFGGRPRLRDAVERAQKCAQPLGTRPRSPDTTVKHKLRVQGDVDHVRKVRFGPRTHRDHDLTCGYCHGPGHNQSRVRLVPQVRAWGFKSGSGRGTVTGHIESRDSTGRH